MLLWLWLGTSAHCGISLQQSNLLEGESFTDTILLSWWRLKAVTSLGLFAGCCCCSYYLSWNWWSAALLGNSSWYHHNLHGDASGKFWLEVTFPLNFVSLCLQKHSVVPLFVIWLLSSQMSVMLSQTIMNNYYFFSPVSKWPIILIMLLIITNTSGLFCFSLLYNVDMSFTLWMFYII